MANNNQGIPQYIPPPTDPTVTAAQQLVQQPPINPQAISTYVSPTGQLMPQQNLEQATILPNAYPVTQQFGNYNPSLETFSGGYAMDTNFGAKMGDSVAAPPVGRWQVVNQNNEASQDGYVSNGENGGYGRAILLQNLDTGERLHYIHLHELNTSLGDMVQPGQKIATVGRSGNVTAENLVLEYYDQNGKIGDIMSSPYAPYIVPQSNQ